MSSVSGWTRMSRPFRLSTSHGTTVWELRSVENDLKLRHRVRTYLLAAEPAEFDREFRGERLAQPLGNRESLGIVINVGVIAVNRRRSGRCVSHDKPSSSFEKFSHSRPADAMASPNAGGADLRNSPRRKTVEADHRRSRRALCAAALLGSDHIHRVDAFIQALDPDLSGLKAPSCFRSAGALERDARHGFT